jgi:hypothetical protein
MLEKKQDNPLDLCSFPFFNGSTGISGELNSLLNILEKNLFVVLLSCHKRTKKARLLENLLKT